MNNSEPQLRFSSSLLNLYLMMMMKIITMIKPVTGTILWQRKGFSAFPFLFPIFCSLLLSYSLSLHCKVAPLNQAIGSPIGVQEKPNATNVFLCI